MSFPLTMRPQQAVRGVPACRKVERKELVMKTPFGICMSRPAPIGSICSMELVRREKIIADVVPQSGFVRPEGPSQRKRPKKS